MSHTAAVPCKPACTAPAKEPFAPKFSAELMKMLSQLVTLR
ncbi:hypothetical protein SAMN05216319_3427 [Duganella sp. CF402]|nr:MULTISPECIES: hypothetical protein [unclassified Duganella]RZT08164.1 hypothetical protein EV582_0191 [Duganella sp. BK701]SEM03481.1 hypothetical protein SAMN05216319_3427 [Duganella sp. CF402]